YRFEIGSRKVFLTDTFGWIFNIAKKELYHIDFKSRQSDTVTDVSDLEFLQDENKVVYKNNKTNTLIIKDMQTRKSIKEADVSFYSLSPDSKRLVAVKSNGECTLFNVKTNRRHQLPRFTSENNRIKKIVFGKLNSEVY